MRGQIQGAKISYKREENFKEFQLVASEGS